MNTIYDYKLYTEKIVRAYVPTKYGRKETPYHLYKNQRTLNNKKLSLFLHDVCDHTKITFYLLNPYYTIARYELTI